MYYSTYWCIFSASVNALITFGDVSQMKCLELKTHPDTFTTFQYLIVPVIGQYIGNDEMIGQVKDITFALNELRYVYKSAIINAY